MEIGYTDTVMEIVATNFDEDADTEMSNNNDSVESVEEMVVWFKSDSISYVFISKKNKKNNSSY